MRIRTPLLVTCALALAGAARAQQKCPAVQLHYDEFENLAKKDVDTNRDCTPDEFVYYTNGKAVRAEKDEPCTRNRTPLPGEAARALGE